MLAQQNSKQNSVFFNLKPTVIDKLISKNKCSIQNNLFYSNEESDESLSGESEASSSSSQGSSVAVVEVQGSSTMAPAKRNNKVGVVLGSKLSAKVQIVMKRKRGRPSGSLGKKGANQKVKATKNILQTRRGRSPKVDKNSPETVKKKRATNASPSSDHVKRPRNSQRQDISQSPKKDKTQKPSEELPKISIGKRKRSELVVENKPENSSPRKSMLNTKNEMPSVVNNQSSPRKFPSNVSDHWKATGLVIRGRGRARGVSSRARGGRVRRGILRGDRYITRDSQVTGLMRSGRMRKLSDPNLVEGLNSFVKRRSFVNKIKMEKSEFPSDERSSFVSTSELSFSENDNSISKLSDDDTSTLGTPKVKVEDTEDESTTDTNSNVFKNRNQKQTPSRKLSKVDDSQDFDRSGSSTTRLELKKTPTQRGRGRRKLMMGVAASTSRPSVMVNESENTLQDPDVKNSPTLKRQKRKHDGSWVRRSTRSVGKTTDEEESGSDVIQELLKDKREDINISTKCSFSRNSEVVCSSDELVKNVCKDEEISDQIETKVAVIETPICNNTIASSQAINFLNSVPQEEISENDLVDIENNKIVNLDTDLENDSLVDFTLEFEESPAKTTSAPAIDEDLVTSVKLNFEASSPSNEFKSIETCDNSLAIVQSNCPVSKVVPEVSSSDEIVTNNFESLLVPELLETRSALEETVPSIAEADFKDGQSDILITNSVSLTMESLLSEKTAEKNCNDQEVLSDENILSMIDSFCHSDTSDFTIDEDNQKIPEQIAKENLTDSKPPLIKDSEEKIPTVEDSETLNSSNGKTVVTSMDVNVNSNESFEPEENTTDFIEDFKEIDTSEETPELQDIKFPSDNTEICLFKGIGESDEKKIEDVDDKMVTDFVSESKSADSTEESSSSDSNSHLMQLVPTQLENELNDRHPNEDKPSIEELSDPQTQIMEQGVEIETAESQSTIDASLANEEQIDKTKDNTISENSSTNSNVSHEFSIKGALSDSNLGSTQEMPSKELLSALGLQSLHSAPEEKPKRPTDSYTGTLKAVIKLNRSSDKKTGGRKIIFKQGDKLTEDLGGAGDRLEYRICSNEEVSTEGVPLTHLGDIPANRKILLKVKSQFDLSNSPNIVGTAGSTDSSTDATKEAGKQNLVIPEKSSSFSIHPERLCTDVCSYCFGKFGSLDTPCHLAQLKNSARQAKILEVEKHLSTDSCLCDGCFRYVDRKANCPNSQRSRKPAARRGPLAGTICAVQECSQAARHSVRRKWLIKLKKSIGKKLVIDMDKNPHLPVPLCSQHYYWVDYFTVCGICKKRLTRNHMYALGPEAEELNLTLSEDRIPVRLSDKLFLCKLCRYYSSLRLRSHRDSSTMTSTSRIFLNSYRKKILHYHDIPVSDSEEEHKSGEEEATKVKKKKSKSKSFEGSESKKANDQEKSDPGNEDKSNDSQMIDYSYLDTLNMRRDQQTTPTMDYNSLGDFEEQVGFSNIASLLNPLEGQGTVYPPDSANRPRAEKPTRIQVKFGNLNIGKLSNLNIGQDSRSTTTTNPSMERPPYLPGERDLKLSGDFEFHGALNPTSSWERCTSTIQFDKETKKTWQELQRPYGNQSSFLRHLIMLEKHWRSGSLVLSENADARAKKYITSVGNRVKSYDGSMASQEAKQKVPVPEKVSILEKVPIPEKAPQPEVELVPTVTSLPVPPRPMSTPVKITSAPPPLMKISPSSMCSWRPTLLRKVPPPPYFPPPSTVTSLSANTNVPQAPPPYRFPTATSPFASRAIKMTVPSPSFVQSHIRSHIRPVSISYQQFKKIRLEKPLVSTNTITAVPKRESVVEIQTPPVERIRPISSAGSDFTPLICDVRSLATTTSTDDWNETYRLQQQKLLKQNVAKYFTPILPKIPNSLTVTTFPQTSQPQLVMKTTSLTIEKAPSTSTKPSPIPPEKPSISVFREPTPDETG